jgi:small subunit ribosomal protein S18
MADEPLENTKPTENESAENKVEKTPPESGEASPPQTSEGSPPKEKPASGTAPARPAREQRPASRPQQRQSFGRRPDNRGRGPDNRGRGPDRRGGGFRGRGRGRFHRRKVCQFCVDKTLVIDWKVTDNLRRYVADSGSISPRRKSGLCARHQRRVAMAIKRARHIAILPYTTEHVRIMGRR